MDEKKKIFPKRIAVFAVLIATLSAVIYLNWQYTADNGELNLTAALETTEKYLGDAEYVNSDVTVTQSTEDGFFSQSRSERETTREESLKMLTAITEDASADSAAKQEAVQKIAEITENDKLQSDIETLIKAKGFSDCVVIISEDSATAIVKVENELNTEQTLQIQDIFLQNTKFSLENIKIFQVK